MKTDIRYRVYFDSDNITWFTDPVWSLDETKPIIEFKKQNPQNTNIRVFKETIIYEEVNIKE